MEVSSAYFLRHRKELHHGSVSCGEVERNHPALHRSRADWFSKFRSGARSGGEEVEER